MRRMPLRGFVLAAAIAASLPLLAAAQQRARADANETICTARVNARCPARAGDDVELAIATDRFHFFDLESGEVITNRAQPAATG